MVGCALSEVTEVSDVSSIQLGRVSLILTDKGIWVSLEALLGAAARGIWVSGYLGIEGDAAHGDLIGRRRLRRERFTGSGGLGVRRRAVRRRTRRQVRRRLLHRERAR